MEALVRDHADKVKAAVPLQLLPARFIVALCLMAVVATATHAGPWSRTGPTGGEVYVLAEDPLRAGHLFAAPASEGLYESFDSGATWSEVPGAPSDIRAIVFDPFDPHRMYIVESAGFRASTDGGRSWSDPTRVEQGEYTGMFSLSASPRVRGLLYMQAANSIYRSNDGGSSWTYQPASFAVGGRGALVVASGTTESWVFASGKPGTYRSTDYGVTWTQVIDGTGWVVFSPHDPKRGIAATPQGVSITSDGGASWTSASSTAKVFRASFDPTIPGRLYGVSYAALYRSDDWGANWTAIQEIPVPAPWLAVATHDPARVFVMAGGYGVLEYTNGTLVPRNTGLWGLPASALLVSGNRLLAGTEGAGNHVSVRGSDWRRLPPGPFDPGSVSSGERVTDLVEIGGAILMSSSLGISRSLDGGESWQQVTAQDAQLVLDIEPGSTPQELYASGWFRIQRSNDQGRTWTVLTSPSAGARLMNSVAYDKQSGQLLVCARNTASPLYRSSDRGITWTAATAPSDTVTFLAVSPHGGLYAGVPDKGLIRSNDGGTTWTTLPGQPNGMLGPTTIGFDPSDPSALVVGTEQHGAYALVTGDRWVPIAALEGREIQRIVRDGSRWIFATDKGVYIKEDPLTSPVRRRSAS